MNKIKLLKSFDWLHRVADSKNWPRCNRLLRNKKGLAAVEFALIAPLLIALILGTVELGKGYTIDRRISNFASSAADLVAQTETVTTADLTDIFALSQTILEPYDTDPVTLVLTSIVADADLDTTVEWSQGFNGAIAHGTGGDYTLAEGLIAEAFGSVILAEVTYTYSTVVSRYITGPITMSKQYFLKPRKVPKVTKSD